jgi:hypothetical protein
MKLSDLNITCTECNSSNIIIAKDPIIGELYDYSDNLFYCSDCNNFFNPFKPITVTIVIKNILHKYWDNLIELNNHFYGKLVIIKGNKYLIIRAPDNGMTATHQFTDNKNNKELTSIYSALEDLAQAKEWIVDVYDSSDYIYKDIKISLIYDQKKLPLVFEF